jgi:hypothetical protein
MWHGSGDESDDQSLKRQAELGRLLVAAEGYRVVASDGASLGWLAARPAVSRCRSSWRRLRRSPRGPLRNRDPSLRRCLPERSVARADPGRRVCCLRHAEGRPSGRPLAD